VFQSITSANETVHCQIIFILATYRSFDIYNVHTNQGKHYLGIFLVRYSQTCIQQPGQWQLPTTSSNIHRYYKYITCYLHK